MIAMSDKKFDIDALVDSLYSETTLVRPEPTIPTVKSVEIIEEKNSQNQINGVNLAIGLEGPPVILGRLIVLNSEKKWVPGPTEMTRSLIDTRRYRDQKAWANCVTLRFGEQSDPTSTYFAVQVPGVSEITTFAQKICDAMNTHGVEPFVEKGLVIRLSDEDKAVVQVNMSRFENFRLYSFCSIGKDGKPVVDLTKNWSLHRQPGRALVERFNQRDGVVETVKSFKPSYRGEIFSRGSRASAVAEGLQKQVIEKVGKELAKIQGTPYESRERAGGQSNADALWAWRKQTNRFAPQSPAQEEQEESNTPAPANAGDLEF